MDEMQTLERLLRTGENRAIADDKSSDDLNRAIEETRRKIRKAFARQKKVNVSLKKTAA